MKNSIVVSALLILASFTSHDACAATAPLEITTPRGGEVYLVGQTQQVRVTGRFKQVIIDLSRDGGATFADVGTIDNTVKDKSLQNLLTFTVAGPAATNCIMRARGVMAKGTIQALSGGFVITDGNTLAPVITMDLADGSVTTPKLATGAVTSAKVSSGAASAGFLLTADGAGGADWAALDTVGLDSRYVLKAGDKLTGALTLSGNPTLALHAAPKQYVDAETTRAQNAETLLTTLLLGESTRAQNAESTLTTNLNAEVTRAQGAEGTLTTALNTEVTRAQGAEGTLTTALNAETTRAQAAENTLTTNLSAEVTARTAAGATLQTNIDGKVSKSGDSMSGALTLSGNPLANLHAAPKQYVDAETTRAQAAESTLTTNLSAETTARTGADTALQTSINTKVAKAGDTMSGPLVLSGDPSANLHAATKQYVDAETTRAQAAEGTLASGKVAKAGDTMTGALVLSGNPALNLHAAPKQYVDAETTRAQGAEGTLTTNLNAEITRATAAESTLTTSVNGKVAKAGDTMTGALTLSGDPTLNLHAATKQYVDAEKTRAQAAEGTLTTNLTNEVTRAQGAEGTLTTNLNAEITRATAAESTLTTSVNGKVSKAGDTMTGALTLSDDPALNLQAATKQYVDASVGAVATIQSGPIYGDGGDGDVVITVDTTIINADKFYNNLTVNPGVTLKFSGRLFVRNTCTINGTISNNGGNGVAGAGGVAGVGGGKGGNSISTGSDSAGDINNGLGGNGGNGGSQDGSTGGPPAGAAGSVAPGSVTVLRALPNAVTGRDLNGVFLGGGAGGGGGGGAAPLFGGGGGGGGVLLVAARVFAGNGSIQAKGGNGGNAAGGYGAGGGGGGGLIVTVSSNSPVTAGITFDVSGGTHGTASGTGTSGTNGTAGRIYNVF
ncbi:MAG TPA: hypothetical protein VKX17_03805 [Planctomycetota bacterium]|nr:hypothetical protein [Planctomycetota bacterium]